MKLEKFNASRLWNAEMVALGDDTLKICNAYDWSTSPAKPLFDKVGLSLAALKKQIHKETTVNETQEVHELDVVFNNAWRAARYYCKAYLLSPDAAEKEAAGVLLDLAKLYGLNLHLESYAVQNANAHLYLNDCDTKDEVKTAIEKIGFQKFKDRIQSSLIQLDLAIDARSQKASNEYREEETKVIRKEIYNNLKSFYKYLEVMSEIDPQSDFANMLKLINESIRNLNRTANRRNRQSQEEVVD